MTTPSALLQEWIAATARGGSLEDARAVCEAARARVERLRDPFLPVARGDSAARAKETVLWEDGRTMVLVDAYGSPPKALVVPKSEMLFPVDGEPAVVDELARVASAVSDAFVAALGGGGPARVWINPPSALSVRQLHVHVQGDGARLSEPDRADRAKPFYARVTTELARALG